jgi:hypothetical protein
MAETQVSNEVSSDGLPVQQARMAKMTQRQLKDIVAE